MCILMKAGIDWIDPVFQGIPLCTASGAPCYGRGCPDFTTCLFDTTRESACYPTACSKPCAVRAFKVKEIEGPKAASLHDGAPFSPLLESGPLFLNIDVSLVFELPVVITSKTREQLEAACKGVEGELRPAQIAIHPPASGGTIFEIRVEKDKTIVDLPDVRARLVKALGE